MARGHLKKVLSLVGLIFLLAGCSQVKTGVLNPQGPVAQKQYDLIIWSVALMSIIFVAVVGIFVFVLVKYRERPDNLDYEPPEQEGSRWLEIIWTVIPVIIVIALAIPTTKTTFELERSPSPEQKPMKIEVTSVDWKWIFRYPEQGIETVNYIKIPANVPIDFELNAVGAMNSFWVPELGGQEYTMPGMTMHLWLEADKPGTYLGRSSNFSGKGFTHMTFRVISQEKEDFNKWISHVKKTAPEQTESDYLKLMKPGNVPEMTYSSYPAVFIKEYEKQQGGEKHHHHH
ncbi:cytochrome aa3 quinol oxidase subunit II [Thermoflavimicrobium daqui]|uniref:cytochrome aa3 quinol oxidase subunit II n=1 Tax=Thermoflavimicrobium daqui TaxID=2137476 RepID=UPI00143CF254|nr:cytochrome aa3 quinol oxidase subunit II [Thermoflavimicrobium daqui]